MAKPADSQSLLESADEQGLALLRRWQESGASVWVCYGAGDGCASAAMQARITEVSRCVTFHNQSSSLRFDLQGARFRYGPLQALLTPSRIGRVAAVAQRPGGLVSKDGVSIVLDSGHSLFICESEESEAGRLKLPVGESGVVEG
jgi:hypothetical protein